jgi:molecular chaperone GrpE
VIETAGQFDPSLHEAVMAAEVYDAGEDGKILEELHRGYRLGEKVLRAAQVKVGRLRKG